MNISPYLIGFFAFISMPTMADDDCVAGEPIAAFSIKTPGLSGYKVEQVKGEGFISERFKIKDGSEVTITQGGCAHFDRAVTFSLASKQAKSSKFDAKWWMSQAKELIAKLPQPNEVTTDLQAEIKDQEAALLKSKLYVDGNKSSLSSTDGNGYRSLRLEVTEKGSTTELLIGVNTAL